MTIRNPAAMLIAGALAGALSGLLEISFALRGASFGLVLTLTTRLVQEKGWRVWSMIPGLLFGAAMGFFPFRLDDLGIGSDLPFDYLTLANVTVAIPLYTFAYLRPRLSARLGYLLLVGVLSAALRTSTYAKGEIWLPAFGYTFVVGILPFLALWLVAMFLTDPQGRRGAEKTGAYEPPSAM